MWYEWERVHHWNCCVWRKMSKQNKQKKCKQTNENQHMMNNTFYESAFDVYL